MLDINGYPLTVGTQVHEVGGPTGLTPGTVTAVSTDAVSVSYPTDAEGDALPAGTPPVSYAYGTDLVVAPDPYALPDGDEFSAAIKLFAANR